MGEISIGEMSIDYDMTVLIAEKKRVLGTNRSMQFVLRSFLVISVSVYMFLQGGSACYSVYIERSSITGDWRELRRTNKVRYPNYLFDATKLIAAYPDQSQHAQGT